MALGLEWLLHLVGLCLKEGVLRVENALLSNYSIKTGCLSKGERIASRSIFEAIYKKGKYIKGRNFVLNYTFIGSCNEVSMPRIKVAFVVSKKVSKLAVCRNRIKRQMREAYRFNRVVLPDNIALAMRALPSVISVSYNEIEREIKHLFEMLAAKESCNSLN